MGTLTRRTLICAAAALCGGALSPRVASAHAALLKTSPKAGSTVASPASVRLQFSEEVVPDLCHVAIVDAGGRKTDLTVANDPHDVRTLVAPLAEFAPGIYKVVWHVVSADGHPVSGSFNFTIAGPAGTTIVAAQPPAVPAADSTTEESENEFPAAAAAFRGVGVTALLGLTGILFFAMGHGGSRAQEYRRTERALAAIAFAALLIHLVLWDRYVMPGQAFAAATWESMLNSPPGRVELIRVVLAGVAAALVYLSAVPLPAFGASVLAVLATAAIGHPATVTPYFSIPLIVVHLGAVAVWLGGLLSLVILRNADSIALAAHARNVSRLALLAAILVTLSGLAQSALLLTAIGDLVTTTYGRLVLAKVVGLILLVSFGAYHRFTALPRVLAGLQRDMTLSLRYEIIVMTCVIVVAAFLSYTPLPR